MLPESVANRKKSGYPGSFDPAYLTAIKRQASDLITSGHPVLDLCRVETLKQAIAAPGETITTQERAAIERALDLAAWLDLRKPTITLD